MDPKLILLQSIMLLYWESRLDAKADSSATIIREIVDDLRLPDASLESDPTRDIVIGLRSAVLYLCAIEHKEPIDRDVLIQRVKLSVKTDPDLIQIIADGLIETEDQALIRKKCVEYSKLLLEYKKEKRFKETVKGWVGSVLYSADDSNLNVKKLALDMQAALEPFSIENKRQGPMGIDGVVGMVDFMDEASVRELFESAIEETSTDGIMRTGYQAINRMFGWHGGMRRGDFIVVGAMEHNYKTGFTLNLTKHVALYNKPYMMDPKKKPMLLHVSSENALTDNLMLMYQSLRENETGEPCDAHGVDHTEATRYIMDRCSINGYTLHMLRVNPSEFTYQSLFSLIMEYESDGFEIHLLTIDYLNMFNKAGCTQGAQGMDTRDLFRRVRNFCSP